MTSRRLIILAALAIVAIASALFLTRQPASPPGAATELLYPKLEAELNSVTGLKIYKAGDVAAVQLTRKGNGWTVDDRSGYDADTGKVNRLLHAIAKARPIEEKTANPENYAALGVQDVSDPKATGARIELIGAPTPVNLIVGKPGPGAQAAYVRRGGEAASWLVNESIDAQASADAWLRKDVINVAADRVQSATVTVAGGKPYAASKKSRADADFQVDPLPKGKELSSPSAADGFATALTAVTLADVRSAKEFDADKPAAHATIKTFDGLVVDVDGWVKEGKHYIAIRTSYDEALEKQFHVAQAEPEKKADAAEGPSPAAVPTKPAETSVNANDEAKTLAPKLAGWVYEVPDYKYEAIFKPLDELLKK